MRSVPARLLTKGDVVCVPPVGEATVTWVAHYPHITQFGYVTADLSGGSESVDPDYEIEIPRTAAEAYHERS